MTVQVKYIEDRAGVIITAFGHVTGDQMIGAMTEIFSDEEKTKGYRYGLCDFTRIETVDMPPEKIVALSRIHIEASKWNQDIVVGFAITSPTVYGLVRVWEVYAELTHWKVHITRSRKETETWIQAQLESPR